MKLGPRRNYADQFDFDARKYNLERRRLEREVARANKGVGLGLEIRHLSCCDPRVSFCGVSITGDVVEADFFTCRHCANLIAANVPCDSAICPFREDWMRQHPVYPADLAKEYVPLDYYEDEEN